MTTIKVLHKSWLPIITIDAAAIAKVQQYVLQCKLEIGWMGLIETRESSNGFQVIKLCEPYAPSQEVGAATCDLDSDGDGSFAEWAVNLAMSGEERLIKWWGHSHVDMGVRPSSTDIDTFAEHIENDPNNMFIMTVHNKKGEIHCNAYLGGGLYAEDLPVLVDYGFPNLIKTVQDELAANVREKIYVRPKATNGYNPLATTGKSTSKYIGSGSSGKQLSQSDIKNRNAASNALGLRQDRKSQHPKPSVRGKSAGAK